MSRVLQISLFLFLIPAAGFGQIQSNAAYKDTTHYDRDTITRNDKLFVFSDSTTAMLIARPMDASGKQHTYVWTRFNIDSLKFCDTIKVDSAFSLVFLYDTAKTDSVIGIDTLAIDSSFLIPPTPGCYEAAISGDTTMRAWVFFDKFDFRIDSVLSTCVIFKLRINNVHLDTIRYIDLSRTDTTVTLINRPITIKWRYDGNEYPKNSYSWDLFTAKNPSPPDPPLPTDTTTFFATVTNTFNHTVTRSYKSWVAMATEAKFSFLEDGEPVYKIDTTKPSGGSPLNIRLVNQSKNGKTFEWYFKSAYTKPTTSDTNCSYPPIPRYDTTYTDVIHWRDLKDTVECKYYSPGKYTIKLVSKNTTCDPDTFTFSQDPTNPDSGYSLKVNASMDFNPGGEFPQIFNANGTPFMLNIVDEQKKRDGIDRLEGMRDEIAEEDISTFTSTWTVTEASIRDIKLTIFDRRGIIVYKYDGTLETDDNKYWDGWNGKIDNTGRECEPGVYYWVVELKGWDDTEYHDSLIKNKTKKTGGGTTSSSGSSSTGSESGMSGTSGSSGGKDSKATQSKAKRVTQGIHTGYVYLVRE